MLVDIQQELIRDAEIVNAISQSEKNTFIVCKLNKLLQPGLDSYTWTIGPMVYLAIEY